MALLEKNVPLTREAVAARRHRAQTVQYVTFSVKALYGLSRQSMRMPLNDAEFIDSGQVCVTIDPDADPSCNTGVVQYAEEKLTVRYGVQAVFPGLYKLITQGNHEPSLLNPVRAVATDECTLTPDHAGWRALGCLEFLPGSIWAGAAGG
ncbi:MAG: hypothetical protein M3416_01055 [Acidobacteriota bacterium]|nr:hypothetical protein [Acidobacteriota bacterium]